MKTTTSGTLISRTGATWSPSDVAFTVNQAGVVSYEINGVGTIIGKTKVNDGNWHEVAVVFSAKEKS